METSIKHQFFFPHSPENVWEYLTKSELIEQWLMKNDFHPALGYDFQFMMKPIPSLNLDGIIYCKVLEIVPFKKLSYSWKGGPGEGKITLDTIVVWKLQPKENGTELFLEHTGFKQPANLDIYNGMDKGWLEKIHKIAEQLNTAKQGATKA